MGILFSRQSEADSTKTQPVEQTVVEATSPKAIVPEVTVPETVIAETTVVETTVPEATVAPLQSETTLVTETLQSDIFERHVEEVPGNKVEVVPVNVNPGADVVKKTNKKKKSKH
jgi:hypothetical protein